MIKAMCLQLGISLLLVGVWAAATAVFAPAAPWIFGVLGTVYIVYSCSNQKLLRVGLIIAAAAAGISLLNKMPVPIVVVASIVGGMDISARAIPGTLGGFRAWLISAPAIGAFSWFVSLGFVHGMKALAGMFILQLVVWLTVLWWPPKNEEVISDHNAKKAAGA